MMDAPRIAAIAGALGYIGEEQAPQTPAARPAAAVPAVSSPWALYGRQHQMDLRAMMQRRDIRRTR
jgi:hypothetical protein